jgi:hypothetical protein
MHRWTNTYTLFTREGSLRRCAWGAPLAVCAFIGGLLGASSPSVAALCERAQQHKEKTQELLKLAMEPVPKTKKPRLEDS